MKIGNLVHEVLLDSIVELLNNKVDELSTDLAQKLFEILSTGAFFEES